jgi:spermidine/putrescine-binding protein
MEDSNGILNSPGFTLGILVAILLVVVMYNVEFTRNLLPGSQDVTEFVSTSTDTLHVFTFAEYFHEDVIRDFSRQHNLTVKISLYGTNEELRDSLMAGNSYDIVVPTDYMVTEMINRGLIREINKDSISNYLNIDVRMRELDYDFGNNFSIPYFWGAIGLMYDNNYVLNPPLSWKALFDTTEIKQVRHRVSVLDDARTSLGIALIANGHSPNTTNPELIKAAADSLIKIAPFLGRVQSDGLEEPFSTGQLYMSMNWSGSAALATSLISSMRFSMPAEGSIFFVDNLAIPVKAKKVDEAYAFINYLLDAQIAADMTNTNFYPNPVTQSRRYIDRMILKGPAYFNPFLTANSNIHFTRDLGAADTLYTYHWQRFTDYYNNHQKTTSQNQRGENRIILH